MYEKLTTTTTTPMSELNKLRYRFGGSRYSFQGGSPNGPAWTVPQNQGLYSFPTDDAIEEDDS